MKIYLKIVNQLIPKKRVVIRAPLIKRKSLIRQKTEQYWESLCQKIFHTSYGQTVSYYPSNKLKLFLIGICLAMSLTGYWLFIQKGYLQLSDVKHQQKKLQSEIIQFRNNLESFPDFKSLDIQQNELHQQIILETQDKWQAIMILTLNESGAKLVDWSPNTAQDRLKISGSFEQLSIFLYLITERLINKKIEELIFDVKSSDTPAQSPLLELSLVLSEVKSD